MKDSSHSDTFSEYIVQGDVSKKRRAENWRIAIGLQGVDHLSTSNYLLETAREQIEGRLDFAEVEKRISDYYKTTEGRALIESRADEADLVATHIAELLAEDTFSLSPAEYAGIHKRLFEGVFSHAGQYRTVNISKAEWVLDGRSVAYASAPVISDTIIYDFDQERKFSYSGLSPREVVSHVAKFISGLWEIHPFREGNTRTTAVFTIRYLRKFGFRANNDLFKEHSLYFRNALVRAVYESYQYYIKPNSIFLERFFENLLFNANHQLRNRYCHIYWEEEPAENTTNNAEAPQINTANNGATPIINTDNKFDVPIIKPIITTRQQEVLDLIRGNPSITIKEVGARLGVAWSAAHDLVKALTKKGVVRRVGAKKNGRWEMVIQT